MLSTRGRDCLTLKRGAPRHGLRLRTLLQHARFCCLPSSLPCLSVFAAMPERITESLVGDTPPVPAGPRSRPAARAGSARPSDGPDAKARTWELPRGCLQARVLVRRSCEPCVCCHARAHCARCPLLDPPPLWSPPHGGCASRVPLSPFSVALLSCSCRCLHTTDTSQSCQHRGCRCVARVRQSRLLGASERSDLCAGSTKQHMLAFCAPPVTLTAHRHLLLAMLHVLPVQTTVACLLPCEQPRRTTSSWVHAK